METNQKVREGIEKEVFRKYPEVQSVCRYRKEGVYQYLKQQEDAVVIIEEKLQGGSPYTTEELQLLSDLGSHRIIFLMDSVHYGDDYVKELYCCGIYDALYLEQAKAKDVLKLIFQGRNCEQAREYYGIQNIRDAEKQHNIVNEEILGAYLEFVEEGDSPEDINLRYRFASGRLGMDENRVLSASVCHSVADCLKGNEVYQYFRGAMRDKRRLLPRIRARKKAETREYKELASEKPNEAIEIPLSEFAERQQIEEAVSTIHPPEIKQPVQEGEETLAMMERFRSASRRDQPDETYPSREDLRVLLGRYLKTVDV